MSDNRGDKPRIVDKVGAILFRNNPKWLIVHHTLMSRDKTTFEAIDKYHKSLGWGKIGYHYFIEGDGSLHQGRQDKEVGAHCKQQGMNYQSFGICLAGNFDKELPSKAQVDTLTVLLREKTREYKIPIERIVPHRHYATYKSCYGEKLPDDWARKLLTDSKFMTVFKIKAESNGEEWFDYYAVANDNKRHLILNWFTFQEGVKMGLWEGDNSVKVNDQLAKLPKGNIFILISDN